MNDAIARPTSCSAMQADDLMVCARCGFEWPAGALAPRCRPITFTDLRNRMLSEVAGAEASLELVVGLGRRGLPTDGGRAARRRKAELEAVLRMVDRLAVDAELKKKFNEKGAAAA